MSGKKRAIIGVAWSGIDRFSVQIIQFVVTIILARILTPNDFGVVAIILVLINILQVFNEVGFGAALMQKLDRDELDYSTVFVFNIIWGVVLYGLVYISAPLFASFFELPELTNLTRILGVNIIISSFIVVQRAKLMIIVDFKTQAKASLLAVIISGIISVYAAYKGLGVMAIIIQQLVNNSINTIFLWIYTKWQPKLQFSYKRFKTLFNYAYKLILARFVNAVFQEIYSLAIGKVYAPAQLGYFNRAKSFTELSSGNITSIVQRVSTPLLCEAQHDNKRMGEVLLKFIKNTAFIVFPLLCGLFVLAEPLIRILLTDKWLPSVWILRVLCPVGMMFVISTFNINVFNATGRTDWALKSEIIKKNIYVGIIAIAVFFGFEALIYSQILIGFIELIISTYYTKKQIELTLFYQIASLSSIFFLSLIMAIIVWSVTFTMSNEYYQLLIGVFAGVISYSIMAYFLNANNFRDVLKSEILKMK